jgi:pyruvate dehydrogenase E2 component (dihydrolipoamide acetyltransferase)
MGEADTARGPTRVDEPTRAESTIARRAAEARATVPDLELSTDVDVTDVDGGIARVVFACAAALREHPRANATYRDGRFELHERVNIGVTVALAHSLLAPTIFDADAKSTDEIADELKRLESRALAGELTPPELAGATFVISDFGSFGIDRGTAVVTPSHAATLVTGATRSVPMVRGGVIVPGSVMTLTLVCDHRIMFGAEAARFLRRIADLIQGP